jgi:hypothetical protein
MKIMSKNPARWRTQGMTQRTYRTRPAGTRVIEIPTSRPQFPLDQFAREMDAFAAIDEAIDLIDGSSLTATGSLSQHLVGFKV